MEEMDNSIVQITASEKASTRNPITKALKSPLFMTVSLLFTIYFGIDTIYGFFMQGSLSLDIITLLLIIGLWMTYNAAKNTPLTDTVPVSGMNLVSGTVKAVRIISLVISILCIVASVAFLVMIPIVNVFPEISETYMGEVQAILYILLKQSFGMFDSASLATAFSIYMVVVSAVMGVLSYIVGYRIFFKKAHKFTYSLCENLKSGTPVENAKALYVWLLVLGICSAVMTLYSGTAILLGGVFSAALIVTSCWIKAYFTHQENETKTPVENQ